MPRKPRQLTDHGYYHLIARGNNRHFILSVPGGHEFFKELLAQSKEKFQWQLSHYCLMSNHFHLLGRIAQGHQLPKLMQYLLFGYSRWYRLKAHYVGHVWQGRYKSPLIEKESYYLECGRYIERNPIRAGLVANAEQYAWSSYRHYALGELIDAALVQSYF
ncbi:MAG: Transposase [Candidatus Saccharibacteria bacterium GW2011_GWA2_46_10]|nr:MAG: Transposase [Candidatus Saccharibacteria bacterium GW2011_GWA2_46_10]